MKIVKKKSLTKGFNIPVNFDFSDNNTHIDGDLFYLKKENVFIWISLFDFWTLYYV